MSRGINKVILVGNLGKDPEVRQTPSGVSVAKFSLATTERAKDKSGEWTDKTEWHNVIAFNRTAEIAGQYLKKGRTVYIEGKIQNRSWDDKETGQKKYITEILVNDLVLLGGGREGGDEGGGGGYSRKSGGGSASSSSGDNNYDQRAPDDLPTAPITDDDVPF